MDIDQVSSTLSGIFQDAKIHGFVTRGLWNMFLRHAEMDAMDYALKFNFTAGYIQALEDAGLVTSDQTSRFAAFLSDLRAELNISSADEIGESVTLN